MLDISSFHIYDILQCKKIVNKYEEEIKNYMIKDIENSTRIFVDIYLIKDFKKKFYLPNSLSKVNKENIIISYVDSENPNINYLRLLINTPDTKEFSLNARTKLKIKKKIKEQEDKLFIKNSNSCLSTEFVVQIIPNLGESKKKYLQTENGFYHMI